MPSEDIIILKQQRNLAATLVLPTIEKPNAAVLLFHGWVSYRHEVGGFYTQLAQSLAQQGIALLRFDFYGCGESSPEHLSDLTIPGMLEDAKNLKLFKK